MDAAAGDPSSSTLPPPAASAPQLLAPIELSKGPTATLIQDEVAAPALPLGQNGSPLSAVPSLLVPVATPPASPRPLTTRSPTQRPTAAQQAAEQRRTAHLIHQLYTRLEEQGVVGDGWEEGLERSRDGIINKQVSEGGMLTVGRKGKGKQLVRETGELGQVQGHELPLKEEQLLQKVDRFGFFSGSHPAALACQHNRIAVLHAKPYSTFPGKSPKSTPLASRKPISDFALRDRAGSTASVVPLPSPTALKLELKRIAKWGDMLRVKTRAGGNVTEWDLAQGVAEGSGGGWTKLQRRVYKGVPDRWRRAVWGLELERFRDTLATVPRKAKSLDELSRDYRLLVTKESNQDVQIDLDVPRTISGHVLFHTRYGQGQRSLFNVLHAFGLHCEQVGGYCQGMGPIAATFLCYFEPERAYACMVRLFDQYNLRHIFEPGFPGLVEAFYVQERLVEYILPDVHQAFKTHSISTSSYATKWYITLFANSVPFATQLRLWDALLLEGLDFLVIAAVAIIWRFKEEFTASNASFESILSALTSYFLVDSDDALLLWIRKLSLRKDLRRKMVVWRREWQGYVADGSSESRLT